MQTDKCETPGGLLNESFQNRRISRSYLGEFGSGKSVPGRWNSKYRSLETRLSVLPRRGREVERG